MDHLTGYPWLQEHPGGGHAGRAATGTATVSDSATDADTETETVTVSVSEPSAPAFWSAFGDPASHEQRGRSVGSGKGCDRAARAPAASFRAGTNALDRCPRGLPGIGIVRSSLGRREVIPAQCRARHAPVSGVSACFHHWAFGWRRRHVMARTSSKRQTAFSAVEALMAPASMRSRRWVSTSFAEP